MAKINLEKLISKYRGSKEDTGSPQIQILNLTSKINKLSQHLKDHPKDLDARIGILKLLIKRRRLLTYLSKYEPSIYK
jgi:small subunit ribosomal protein S15